MLVHITDQLLVLAKRAIEQISKKHENPLLGNHNSPFFYFPPVITSQRGKEKKTVTFYDHYFAHAYKATTLEELFSPLFQRVSDQDPVEWLLTEWEDIFSNLRPAVAEHPYHTNVLAHYQHYFIQLLLALRLAPQTKHPRHIDHIDNYLFTYLLCNQENKEEFSTVLLDEHPAPPEILADLYLRYSQCAEGESLLHQLLESWFFGQRYCANEERMRKGKIFFQALLLKFLIENKLADLMKAVAKVREKLKDNQEAQKKLDELLLLGRKVWDAVEDKHFFSACIHPQKIENFTCLSRLVTEHIIPAVDKHKKEHQEQVLSFIHMLIIYGLNAGYINHVYVIIQTLNEKHFKKVPILPVLLLFDFNNQIDLFIEKLKKSNILEKESTISNFMEIAGYNTDALYDFLLSPTPKKVSFKKILLSSGLEHVDFVCQENMEESQQWLISQGQITVFFKLLRIEQYETILAEIFTQNYTQTEKPPEGSKEKPDLWHFLNQLHRVFNGNEIYNEKVQLLERMKATLTKPKKISEIDVALWVRRTLRKWEKTQETEEVKAPSPSDESVGWGASFARSASISVPSLSELASSFNFNAGSPSSSLSSSSSTPSLQRSMPLADSSSTPLVPPLFKESKNTKKKPHLWINSNEGNPPAADVDENEFVIRYEDALSQLDAFNHMPGAAWIKPEVQSISNDNEILELTDLLPDLEEDPKVKLIANIKSSLIEWIAGWRAQATDFAEKGFNLFSNEGVLEKDEKIKFFKAFYNFVDDYRNIREKCLEFNKNYQNELRETTNHFDMSVDTVELVALFSEWVGSLIEKIKETMQPIEDRKERANKQAVFAEISSSRKEELEYEKTITRYIALIEDTEDEEEKKILEGELLQYREEKQTLSKSISENEKKKEALETEIAELSEKQRAGSEVLAHLLEVQLFDGLKRWRLYLEENVRNFESEYQANEGEIETLSQAETAIARGRFIAEKVAHYSNNFSKRIDDNIERMKACAGKHVFFTKVVVACFKTAEKTTREYKDWSKFKEAFSEYNKQYYCPNAAQAKEKVKEEYEGNLQKKYYEPVAKVNEHNSSANNIRVQAEYGSAQFKAPAAEIKREAETICKAAELKQEPIKKAISTFNDIAVLARLLIVPKENIQELHAGFDSLYANNLLGLALIHDHICSQVEKFDIIFKKLEKKSEEISFLLRKLSSLELDDFGKNITTEVSRLLEIDTATIPKEQIILQYDSLRAHLIALFDHLAPIDFSFNTLVQSSSSSHSIAEPPPPSFGESCLDGMLHFGELYSQVYTSQYMTIHSVLTAPHITYHTTDTENEKRQTLLGQITDELTKIENSNLSEDSRADISRAILNAVKQELNDLIKNAHSATQSTFTTETNPSSDIPEMLSYDKYFIFLFQPNTIPSLQFRPEFFETMAQLDSLRVSYADIKQQQNEEQQLLLDWQNRLDACQSAIVYVKFQLKRLAAQVLIETSLRTTKEELAVDVRYAVNINEATLIDAKLDNNKLAMLVLTNTYHAQFKDDGLYMQNKLPSITITPSMAVLVPCPESNNTSVSLLTKKALKEVTKNRSTVSGVSASEKRRIDYAATMKSKDIIYEILPALRPQASATSQQRIAQQAMRAGGSPLHSHSSVSVSVEERSLSSLLTYSSSN